jgi:hypothetical protein
VKHWLTELPPDRAIAVAEVTASVRENAAALRQAHEELRPSGETTTTGGRFMDPRFTAEALESFLLHLEGGLPPGTAALSACRDSAASVMAWNRDKDRFSKRPLDLAEQAVWDACSRVVGASRATKAVVS